MRCECCAKTECGMEAEFDMHEIHGDLDVPWGLFQLLLSWLIMCKVGRIISFRGQDSQAAPQGVPRRVTFHQH